MSKLNNSIDKMVENEFLTLYHNATEKSDEAFSQYLSKIKDSSFYDQIKFLNELMEKKEREKEEVNVLAYTSGNRKDQLLSLYSSRTSVLGIDDSAELSQGVYLSKLSKKISDYLTEIKDEIPPYSYSLFLKGEYDPILFDLDYFAHIDPEDLLKISYWQWSQVSEVVSLETSKVVSKIQNRIKNDSDELLDIEDDVWYYENNIWNSSFNSAEGLSTDDLIERLAQLSFMSEYDVDSIHFPKEIKEYKKFVRALSLNKITPEYIERLRDRLNSSSEEYPFTESPFIFYTIHQIISWIKTVLENESVQEDFTYPDYRTIAKKAMIEAKFEADKLIDDFNNEINISALTEKEAEATYIEALEGLRREFNNSGKTIKGYFGSIQRQDNTEKIFELNTLLSDLNKERQSLKMAYILSERINFFLNRCRIYSSKGRVEYPSLKKGYNKFEAMYLIYNMVLDNDLYKKSIKILDDFYLYTHEYYTSYEIAEQNSRLDMHNLFHECLKRLIGYLEDADVSNKVIYIRTRLKQLKQNELASERLKKRFNHYYTSLFREYLESEVEYIEGTKGFSLNKPANRNRQTQKETPSSSNKTSCITSSFGFRYSDETGLTSLKLFLIDLNKRIGLLWDDDVNAVDDLFAIFTAKKITDELSKVRFKCETAQLYYIFTKLKPYFKKLTFVKIERSQLFKTQSGILLRAQNLSSSKVENPKDYEEINRAFTHLQ